MLTPRIVGVLVHLVVENGRNGLARNWAFGSTQLVHARARRVCWRIWNRGRSPNPSSSPSTFVLSYLARSLPPSPRLTSPPITDSICMSQISSAFESIR